MRIKKGFYFIGWMMKRLMKVVFKFPMKVHRAFMGVYQDNRGLGFLAWFTVTAVGVFLSAGIIGLSLAKTVEEWGTYFGMLVKIGWSVSAVYFVTCVILDQYEKFETERMATWHNLKD